MHAPDLASRQIAKHYDDQPYHSHAFSYAAPGHLYATAHLYGLDAVDPRHARVLEIGCAAGGNLLPFALAHPQAQAIGIDLSRVQIDAGREVAEASGAHNLQLRAMSLTDVDASFGQFDYIIAHGVFSWVPPEVRTAILQLCRERLSPRGIAYISYNTYPGWKAGDIVRDAMLLHSHHAQTPQDRLAGAKAMLTMLAEGLAAGNPLAASLQAAVAQLRRHSDYYLAHEYLEAFNAPCYVAEFAAAAAQAGLGYIGDAESHGDMPGNYGTTVQLHQTLLALGQSKVMRQQYLDFAVGRSFRKSLLGHDDVAAAASALPDLARLADLRIAGHFTREDDPVGAEPGYSHWRNHRGKAFATRDAGVVAVMQRLTQAWPAALGLHALCAGAQTTSDPGAPPTVLAAMQTLFTLNAVYLARGDDRQPPARTGDRPALLPGFLPLWHRAQAKPAVGIGCFNAWHDVVNLTLKPVEAWLLARIDGTRTEAELGVALRDALQRGQVLDEEGRSRQGQRNLDAAARRIVTAVLTLLRRLGVLVS